MHFTIINFILGFNYIYLFSVGVWACAYSKCVGLRG